MIEEEAAIKLWGRSVECHRLRYTTMLSDGDSKTQNELNQCKLNGDGVVTEKEECVNHVSKRFFFFSFVKYTRHSTSPAGLHWQNTITFRSEIFHSCDVVCVALPLCAIGSVHPASALVFLSEFPSRRRSADQG